VSYSENHKQHRHILYTFPLPSLVEQEDYQHKSHTNGQVPAVVSSLII